MYILHSLDKSTWQVTNLSRFRFLKSLRIHYMYREWWTLMNAGDHFKRTAGFFRFPIGNMPLPSQSLFQYTDIISISFECSMEPPPLYCHLKISTLHACLCEQLCDVNPRGLSRIKKQLKIRHSKRSFSLPVNRPKFAVAVFYDCSDGASSPIFCWDNIYTTFIIPILCDVIILYYTYNMQQP